MTMIATEPQIAPDDLLKAWTDDYLLVFEDITPLLPEAANAGEGAKFTREAYLALVDKAHAETEKGVAFVMRGLTVVGQKKA
jgi:hypothetical protein